MKKFEQHQYTISRHFAIAGVNGDLSGMEQDDIDLMNSFDQKLIERHGNAHYIIEQNDSEDTTFTQCDICNLAADCINIIILTEKEN